MRHELTNKDAEAADDYMDACYAEWLLDQPEAGITDGDALVRRMDAGRNALALQSGDEDSASYRNSPRMNWPYALTYFWMIAAWVFGIAAAKGFWITLGSVLLPPMAWVVLAQWVLERFVP